VNDYYVVQYKKERHVGWSRGVLQGAWRGSHDPFVNFWKSIRAICYRRKIYQIIQSIQQYKIIGTS
jgi:hypothetical protein